MVYCSIPVNRTALFINKQAPIDKCTRIVQIKPRTAMEG